MYLNPFQIKIASMVWTVNTSDITLLSATYLQENKVDRQFLVGNRKYYVQKISFAGAKAPTDVSKVDSLTKKLPKKLYITCESTWCEDSRNRKKKNSWWVLFEKIPFKKMLSYPSIIHQISVHLSKLFFAVSWPLRAKILWSIQVSSRMLEN